MAEKQERILIDVINPGINCVYRSDHNPKGQALCTHNGEMEPVTAKECRHCLEGMSRQEAIEKMAKAICANEDEYTDCKQCGFNEPEDCKRYYRNNWLYTAEAALNALLGESND